MVRCRLFGLLGSAESRFQVIIPRAVWMDKWLAGRWETLIWREQAKQTKQTTQDELKIGALKRVV